MNKALRDQNKALFYKALGYKALFLPYKALLLLLGD